MGAVEAHETFQQPGGSPCAATLQPRRGEAASDGELMMMEFMNG